MTTRRLLSFGVCLMTACGGATTNEPAAATNEPAVATEPIGSVAVADEAPAVPVEQVVGLWCQYWIPPEGEPVAPTPLRGADSEQYLFLEDGRFGWRAETSAGEEPKKRSGQWRISGSAIVLTDTAGQEDRLPIAECPSNPEAEQLDARYRCSSLDGNAFWLSKSADQVEASTFIP